MARNSNHQTVVEAPVIEEPKVRKPRTTMHKFEIVRTTIEVGLDTYLALFDGKLTADIMHSIPDDQLWISRNSLNSYDGILKYYKQNKDAFTTIFVSKSPDTIMLEASSAPHVVLSTIRQYLDVKMAREQSELTLTGTVEITEDQPTE